VSSLLSALSAFAGAAAAISLGLGILKILSRTESMGRMLGDLLETLDWLSGLAGRPGRRQARPPGLPVSTALLGLAVRRLPATMADGEKARWVEEMAADLSAVGGPIRRLLFVLRLWRKGAAAMPLGAEGSARSAGD
jgi:hypothetical protein